MESNSTVSLQSIQDARHRISDVVHKTPVVDCPDLAAMTLYKHMYFKCENLQRIGAFKFRGAVNAVRTCLEKRRGDGGTLHVVTHSSGNHAQAIALACKTCGDNVVAHVVMPSNAPPQKKAATRGYGAEVVECPPTLDARKSTAQSIMDRYGAESTVFVHPYDNPDVISGQGTLALEMHEQLPDDVEVVVVPVGGGGLLSGVSTAIKALRPHVMVVGAEPEGADDAKRSLELGRVQPHREGHPNTIADGLLTTLCPRTFELISKNVDKIVSVTEREIAVSMRYAMDSLKMVIEPSAAVGVAAVLSGKMPIPTGTNASVAIVLCGGNLDVDRLGTLLAAGNKL
eukprot:PhM_4_TR5042/c0_g2_i1/m.76668/K12235/SRR; serine racemase